MKKHNTLNIQIGILLIMVLIYGCQKHDDMEVINQDQNLSSLDGMIIANESAKIYNDSITWGLNPQNSSQNEFLIYCDSLFHQYDNEYEMYHNNYGHMNSNNNHHHNNNSSCCSNKYSGNNQHEFGCETNMSELRENHIGNHNSIEKLTK